MFTTRRLRLRTFDPSADLISVAALEKVSRRIGSSPFGVASSVPTTPVYSPPTSISTSSSKAPHRPHLDDAAFENDLKKRIDACFLYLVIETRTQPGPRISLEREDSKDTEKASVPYSDDESKEQGEHRHRSSVPKFVGVIGLVGPVSPAEGINRAVEVFISVSRDAAAATGTVVSGGLDNDATATSREVGDETTTIGYGAEALECVLGHAFGVLGMHRVGVSSVVDGDEKTYDLYRRLGFTEEGRRRKAVWGEGGEWKDAIQMGILDEEWLAKKRGVHISPAASLISASEIFAPHTPF